MKLEHTLRASCTVALLLSATAATAELSANVALTSDYVYRGFSQTSGDPAIQGGFDFAHDSGFYIGLWGSNVESDPASSVNYDGASIEIDVYAGWGTEFDNGLSVDANVLRYMYPGARSGNDFDTTEYTVGAGYDFGFASVSGAVHYSDDFFGAKEAVYYDFGVEVPIGTVTLAAHYGVTDYDNHSLGQDDYNDFSLGVSTEYSGFGFDLSYYETDGVRGGCSSNDCDGRVVFTLSKSI